MKPGAKPAARSVWENRRLANGCGFPGLPRLPVALEYRLRSKLYRGCQATLKPFRNWGWSGFVAGKEPGFRPENRRVRLEIDTKEEPVFSLRLGTPKRLHGMRQGFGIRASYAKPELRVGSGKGFLLRDVAR